MLGKFWFSLLSVFLDIVTVGKGAWETGTVGSQSPSDKYGLSSLQFKLTTPNTLAHISSAEGQMPSTLPFHSSQGVLSLGENPIRPTAQNDAGLQAGPLSCLIRPEIHCKPGLAEENKR